MLDCMLRFCPALSNLKLRLTTNIQPRNEQLPLVPSLRILHVGENNYLIRLLTWFPSITNLIFYQLSEFIQNHTSTSKTRHNTYKTTNVILPNLTMLDIHRVTNSQTIGKCIKSLLCVFPHLSELHVPPLSQIERDRILQLSSQSNLNIIEVK